MNDCILSAVAWLFFPFVEKRCSVVVHENTLKTTGAGECSLAVHINIRHVLWWVCALYWGAALGAVVLRSLSASFSRMTVYGGRHVGSHISKELTESQPPTQGQIADKDGKSEKGGEINNKAKQGASENTAPKAKEPASALSLSSTTAKTQKQTPPIFSLAMAPLQTWKMQRKTAFALFYTTGSLCTACMICGLFFVQIYWHVPINQPTHPLNSLSTRVRSSRDQKGVEECRLNAGGRQGGEILEATQSLVQKWLGPSISRGQEDHNDEGAPAFSAPLSVADLLLSVPFQDSLWDHRHLWRSFRETGSVIPKGAKAAIATPEDLRRPRAITRAPAPAEARWEREALALRLVLSAPSTSRTTNRHSTNVVGHENHPTLTDSIQQQQGYGAANEKKQNLGSPSSSNSGISSSVSRSSGSVSRSVSKSVSIGRSSARSVSKALRSPAPSVSPSAARDSGVVRSSSGSSSPTLNAPAPSVLVPLVCCGPLVLFFLHCAVRFAETFLNHKYRDDGTDVVTIFAMVSGCTFYAVAALSLFVTCLELMVGVTEGFLAVLQNMLIGATLGLGRNGVVLHQGAGESAPYNLGYPIFSSAKDMLSWLFSRRFFLEEGVAGVMGMIVGGREGHEEEEAQGSGAGLAWIAGCAVAMFVLGAIHILLQVLQVGHHHVLAQLQVKRRLTKKRILKAHRRDMGLDADDESDGEEAAEGERPPLGRSRSHRKVTALRRVSDSNEQGNGSTKGEKQGDTASEAAKSENSSPTAKKWGGSFASSPPFVPPPQPTKLPEPPYEYPSDVGLFSIVLEPHYGLEVLQYAGCIALAGLLFLLTDALVYSYVDSVARYQGVFEDSMSNWEASLAWERENERRQRRVCKGERDEDDADEETTQESSHLLLRTHDDRGLAQSRRLNTFVLRPSPLWGGDFAYLVYGTEAVVEDTNARRLAEDGGEQSNSRLVPLALTFLCDIIMATPGIGSTVATDRSLCVSVFLQPFLATLLKASYALFPTFLLMFFSLVNLNATAKEHRAFWGKLRVTVPYWNLIPFVA